MATEKCEHDLTAAHSRVAAQANADELTRKTGILHVVKKWGSLWIATCNYFEVEYKDYK